MSVIRDDDDDDCVIFEGSPLYESLMQSGYDLKGDEVIGSLKSEICSSRDNTVSKLKEEKKIRTHSLTFFARVKHQVICVYRWLVGYITSQVNYDYQIRQNNLMILKKLKQCSTLDEDDADFIDWFIDTSHTDDDLQSTKSKLKKWLNVGLVPVILSYSYTRILQPYTYGKISMVTDFVFCILSMFLSTQAVLLLVNSFRASKYRQEVSCVIDFLGGCERLLVTLKSSLRLIQETELIARGFTLVSQRNPLSRLEEGKRQTIRQCPVLRKLLFTCSRDSIHLLREKTRLLLKQLPDNPEIDVRSGYLAFEPVENYGPCLQETTDVTDSHIYSLTDGFSVSALKGISHLMMLHLSEFIKSLAIYYQHDYKHKDLDHAPVLALIENLLTEVTSRTNSVQRSIDFHNSSFVRKQTEERRVTEKSKYDDLLIAVHSLDLHLQSALTRVRSLASQIEEHDALNDQSGDLGHGYMEEMMQPIKAELTSCNSCYSETLSRFEKLQGISTNDETNNMPMPSKQTDKDLAKDNTKEIEDYIIVDQVFEAYTDADDIGMEDTGWENFLSAEEKEIKRKEKEEAIRMMSELKCVIKVRAKDTEKRETAALLRTKMGLEGVTLSDMKDTVAKETSQSLISELSPNPHTIINGKGNTGFVTDDNVERSKTLNDEDGDGDISLGENKQQTSKCQAGNIEGDVSQIVTASVDESRTKSVITRMGVRRLRKSRMLDDSDSDDGVMENAHKNSSLDITSNKDEQTNNNSNREELSVHTIQRSTCSSQSIAADNMEVNTDVMINPISNAEHKFHTNQTQDLIISDSFESEDVDNDDDEVVDEISRPNITSLSLEERLARYSGLDFCLTSNIAAIAAARSKEFVKSEETTFGGDVYGELSESESEQEA